SGTMDPKTTSGDREPVGENREFMLWRGKTRCGHIKLRCGGGISHCETENFRCGGSFFVVDTKNRIVAGENSLGRVKSPRGGSISTGCLKSMIYKLLSIVSFQFTFVFPEHILPIFANNPGFFGQQGISLVAQYFNFVAFAGSTV
ncbi:hypothetical protein SAMN05444274_104458, partial [Mariniphaga anaerophila]